MKNWFIPSVENQTLVLDRLAEFYFSWVDSFVELMSEMTWEISFKELRSTILYLVEFWYIQRSYTWKWNEFFVKITKKWITYYEKVFQPEEKLHIKDSFLDKIKKLSEWIDSVKWIATWAVAIFTIFWVSFHSEISDKFSANVFHENEAKIDFTKEEAIKFLKKKFPKSVYVSCKSKTSLEMICNIKFSNFQKNILRNSDFRNKKTISNKEIVLRKDSKWKIIFY